VASASKAVHVYKKYTVYKVLINSHGTARRLTGWAVDIHGQGPTKLSGLPSLCVALGTEWTCYGVLFHEILEIGSLQTRFFGRTGNVPVILCKGI